MVDFRAVNRVGVAPIEVSFEAIGVGQHEYIKWLFGDGEVHDGNDEEVTHTYTSPGKYKVTLIVGGPDYQHVAEKYAVFVNESIPDEHTVIAESNNREGARWRLSIDRVGHVVFDDGNSKIQTVDKVIEPGNWYWVDFDISSGEIHTGSYEKGYTNRECRTVPSTFVLGDADGRAHFRIMPNSSLAISSLKIWSDGEEPDIKPYFESLRPQIGALNPIEK